MHLPSAAPESGELPAIEFCGVSKHYGSVRAVENLSLAVHKGEFITLLGPSGCGKTTSLMMLSGFEKPTEGKILIHGKEVNDVPAYRRDQGIVFQSYALFPHMTVWKNLEFPLEMRGVPAADRARKVKDFLAKVHLDGMSERYPMQLSGGQQQRVALARALIADPLLLLLDEPLGALDRNLRENMQAEIKALHTEFGITTVCVTHDQEEALTLSDRIVVMNKGVIVQVDTPEAIYDRPSNLFVASFLGDTNDITRLTASSGNGKAIAVIRPERLKVSAARPPADKMQSAVAKVERVTYLGAQRKYSVRAGDADLVVREAAVPGEKAFAEGDPVVVAWDPADIRWVD